MTSYDNLLVRAQDLVNVEVAVLVSPSLIVLMVSVDVKQHSKKNNLLHTERHIEDFCSTCGTHPPDMLCLSVWNKCLKCHVYGLCVCGTNVLNVMFMVYVYVEQMS